MPAGRPALQSYAASAWEWRSPDRRAWRRRLIDRRYGAVREKGSARRVRRREHPRAQHRRCKLGELVRLSFNEPRRGDAIISPSRYLCTASHLRSSFPLWRPDSPGLRLRRCTRSYDGVAPSGRSLALWSDLGKNAHSASCSAGILVSAGRPTLQSYAASAWEWRSPGRRGWRRGVWVEVWGDANAGIGRRGGRGAGRG